MLLLLFVLHIYIYGETNKGTSLVVISCSHVYVALRSYGPGLSQQHFPRRVYWWVPSPPRSLTKLTWSILSLRKPYIHVFALTKMKIIFRPWLLTRNLWVLINHEGCIKCHNDLIEESHERIPEWTSHSSDQVPHLSETRRNSLWCMILVTSKTLKKKKRQHENCILANYASLSCWKSLYFHMIQNWDILEKLLTFQILSLSTRFKMFYLNLLSIKNQPANAGDERDAGSISGLGRSPWRRAWQPTPVFLPGESHGQRSLVGCSPKGHKDLDTTEVT